LIKRFSEMTSKELPIVFEIGQIVKVGTNPHLTRVIVAGYAALTRPSSAVGRQVGDFVARPTE
jgi:hypothetical protein